VASKGASSVEASKEALIQPNASHRYQVSERDLPLSCPMPGMHLWNSHPRVYLPINKKSGEKTGEVKCPYCSAVYELVSESDDSRDNGTG
jgi:uncharacterized Zn-finger protein